MKIRRKLGDKALTLIKNYESSHRTAFRIPSPPADAPELTDNQLIRLNQKYADIVDSIGMPHGVQLTDDQRDALISFAYDMGVSNLRKLIRVPFDEIADEMLKYDKVDGVVYPGLTQRRTEESALFGGGSSSDGTGDSSDDTEGSGDQTDTGDDTQTGSDTGDAGNQETGSETGEGESNTP